MKECNCDLRTKLVGDGCAICNPAQALEYALGTIEDLEQERDELSAQVDARDAALRKIRDEYGIRESSHPCDEPELNTLGEIADKSLSITPSATLREIEARVLEEAAMTDELDDRRDILREMAAAKRKG